jgi:hypothetical protein
MKEGSPTTTEGQPTAKVAGQPEIIPIALQAETQFVA